ncbi:Netrin-1 [Eumeta japonica]|uniref:Netrin-1 n=1 Tax=Eumeta variegata TaxID=151549 RepID=A0A4C1XFR7_EUMVA|nr:Netrin-1 [Eumeta japonica]
MWTWLACVALAAGAGALAPDPCYEDGRPRRCIPDFVNAAFGAPVAASSACGRRGPERLCDPPALTGAAPAEDGSACRVCDAARADRRYGAALLTDLNNPQEPTCWRSAALAPATYESPPDNVTLTLSLGKKYELTYVSLQFCPRAARPDSVAIYKSADYGVTWQPFQFYSSQCRRVYGRPNRATVTAANEQEARCSDATRTAGPDGAARLAFSTLEGRPSAAAFDTSPVLQDWVTATDVRVVFNRLHMAGPADSGEESAGGSGVPQAPFGTQHYAVADFAVGGRCKCNGHASRCLSTGGAGGEGAPSLACECRHNTAGRDCERCKPFHFDRPWGRATARDANECKATYRFNSIKRLVSKASTRIELKEIKNISRWLGAVTVRRDRAARTSGPTPRRLSALWHCVLIWVQSSSVDSSATRAEPAPRTCARADHPPLIPLPHLNEQDVSHARAGSPAAPARPRRALGRCVCACPGTTARRVAGESGGPATKKL